MTADAESLTTWKYPALRGAFVLALLLLPTAIALACGITFPGGDTAGQPSAPSDPEQLILDDVTMVVEIDFQAMMVMSELPVSGLNAVLDVNDGGEDTLDFQDRIEDDWDDADLSLGTDIEDVETFLSLAFRNEGYFVVKGDFDFGDIESELEDHDFEEDTYRDHSIWQHEDGDSVALFEEVGIYVYGDEDTVKDVLKGIALGEGFMEDEAELRRIMDASGEGLVRLAMDCGALGIHTPRTLSTLVGKLDDQCETVAIVVVGGDEKETEAEIGYVYRSERRAESAIEDIEESLEDSDAIDADVEDIAVDADIVTVEFTVYTDSSTQGSAAPAPAAPVPAPPAAPQVNAGQQLPFQIGVMESLTGPGEIYGTVAKQAKQMAVDEINAAGGINGRMIELIVEDSKCNAQDAITAYNKLTDVDGVKIILGTSCSGAMLGAAPLAEADGVVMLSGLATNPDIAEAGDYIFRTAMSDAQLGIDTGNVIWTDGIRKLATINESTYYAEGVRRASVAQFEKRGGEVVAAEQYDSATTDFRTQLTRLLNANPDAIHVAAQGEFSGGTIIKQLRELGYQGPIYSEVVPVGSEALNIAGDAATGLRAITADLDPANDRAQQVLRNFGERYGHVILPWYLGSAYDDVYITAECLKRTGDDQDADGFRDCLYDITWSGAIGENYSFDDKGEAVGISNVVVEVLPTAMRTNDNNGYRILGPASAPVPAPAAVPAPASAPAPAPVVDDDHGGDRSSATRISVDDVVDGDIEADDDRDFFSFRTRRGGKYIVETRLRSHPRHRPSPLRSGRRYPRFARRLRERRR